MNHFQQADRLLQRIGPEPVLLEADDSHDLLSGTDNVCRSLHVVVRDDLTPILWSEFAAPDRDKLITSYEELGERAEILRSKMGFDDDSSEFSGLNGDILRMAKQSAAAQFIATCLDSRFREFRPAIEIPDVTNLAVASLKSVIAWRPVQEYFSADRVTFYRNKFTSGLTAMERVFWHYL